MTMSGPESIDPGPSAAETTVGQPGGLLWDNGPSTGPQDRELEPYKRGIMGTRAAYKELYMCQCLASSDRMHLSRALV